MVQAVKMTTAEKLEEASAAWNERCPRPHLGASEIGEECARKLWFGFRWAKHVKHPGRMMRLFDRGDREEAPLVKLLQQAGIRVERVNVDKAPIHFTKFAGHFGGPLDAMGRGFPEFPDEWMVVEFKTHNNKSFLQLQELCVFVCKPLHWTQMQVYMGFTSTKHACYIAVNKDNDELYVEFVAADPSAYEVALERARTIVEASEPPEGYQGTYDCRWCAYSASCKSGKVLANCRTCKHSCPVLTPEEREDGVWWCNLHGYTIEGCTLDVEDHRCPEYEAIAIKGRNV